VVGKLLGGKALVALLVHEQLIVVMFNWTAPGWTSRLDASHGSRRENRG